MKTLFMSLLLSAAFLMFACTPNKPGPVIDNIVAAVDADNAQELQKWVDMPAVQASLAKQYTQWLALKMGGMSDWHSAQQSGMDERMAQRLVEEAITPEGLLKLMQGDQQVLLGNLNADYVPKETLRTPLKNRTIKQTVQHSFFKHSVCLTDNATHKPMIILHLGTAGLGWKLTSVQVPMWGNLYEY